jgi:hypothetical protein
MFKKLLFSAFVIELWIAIIITIDFIIRCIQAHRIFSTLSFELQIAMVIYFMILFPSYVLFNLVVNQINPKLLENNWNIFRFLSMSFLVFYVISSLSFHQFVSHFNDLQPVFGNINLFILLSLVIITFISYYIGYKCIDYILKHER